MIFIDRERPASDGNPIRPSDAWFQRAAKATEELKRAGKPAEFNRDLYGGTEPKVALEELFHRKCAYCESPLDELGFDVEHYRPKGRVKEAPSHPGYYWLAYEWSNLFPSCRACNRKLKDHPSYTDAHLGTAAGKLDQFPVKQPAARVTSPADDLNAEEPLLLNPCVDNPEDYLAYGLIGSIVAVRGDERAAASIEVFHLGRKRLRDRRKKRLRELRSVLESGGRPDAYIQDNSEYAGFCRYVLSDPGGFLLPVP